jgi:lipopolysaccharide export system permease protein
MRFFIAFIIVFGALAMLALLIDLADLYGRTANRDVPAGIVLSMGLFKFPDLTQKILPFCVLFGAILAFSRQSRSQELVATRAAGISAWQFLTPPLGVAIVLGLLSMSAFSPLAASLYGQYQQLESKYIRGEESQLSIARTGFWLRQGNLNSQSVIHALKVSYEGIKLTDVTVFLYGGRDQFLGRVDAAGALLRDHSWQLDKAWVSGPDRRPHYQDRYDLPTDLTPTQIQENFASPDTISFWDLPRFIANAENAGFSALQWRLYWYSLMTQPLLFAAMVLLAASFSLRLSRLGGVSRLVISAALSGFAVYFLGDVTEALGKTGIIPLPLAAIGPAAVAILLGMTLLFHEEDG